jgi:hypothetical protein
MKENWPMAMPLPIIKKRYKITIDQKHFQVMRAPVGV